MFGTSPGKIEIQIDKFNFRPGETIEGTVALRIKKPVKAKGVKIQLVCERTQNLIASNRSRNKQIIFDIEQELDGEKEYEASEESLVYPFRIRIPKDLFKKPDFGEGGVGKMFNALGDIASALSNVKWTLIGRLDIPMGSDLSKKININITE